MKTRRTTEQRRIKATEVLGTADSREQPTNPIDKVPPEHVEEMVRQFQKCMDSEQWGKMYMISAPLFTLYPELRAQLIADDKVWERAREKIPQQPREKREQDWLAWMNRWNEFVAHTRRVLVTFPDHRDELNLDENAFDQAREALENLEQVEDHSRQLIRIVQLFPEKRKELGFGSEELWGTWEAKIDKVFAESIEYDNPGRAWSLMHSLKIVFPEKSAGPALTADSWNEMWEAYEWQFKTYTDDRISSPINQLIDMAVLAADRVEIGEDGLLKIHHQEPSLDTTPPLPKRSQI